MFNMKFILFLQYFNGKSLDVSKANYQTIRLEKNNREEENVKENIHLDKVNNYNYKDRN